ncbi:MAG: hypothetical protein N2255_08785, partial [Kiritimatiellae bacterium]|nr:hypothetical protein [Kiritimatiellia bacterium]
MELIGFNGWENCVRLANRAVELIATTEVGPRIIRFGFHGGRNLFAEIAGEQGGRGEESWKIRGGHRLWFAPEDKNLTYEPDNSPVKFEAIRGGVRLKQSVGPLSRIQKTMDVMLDSRLNRVRVVHTL